MFWKNLDEAKDVESVSVQALYAGGGATPTTISGQ